LRENGSKLESGRIFVAQARGGWQFRRCAAQTESRIRRGDLPSVFVRLRRDKRHERRQRAAAHFSRRPRPPGFYPSRRGIEAGERRGQGGAEGIIHEELRALKWTERELRTRAKGRAAKRALAARLRRDMTLTLAPARGGVLELGKLERRQPEAPPLEKGRKQRRINGQTLV
jgi:hypothetical protein